VKCAEIAGKKSQAGAATRQQQEGTYVHHVTLQLGDNMVEFPIMTNSRISIGKREITASPKWFR
jgi:hypothetical protein